MDREAEMKREAAMKELAEGMRKLFPGLVFVPSGSGMDAATDGMAGRVYVADLGRPVFSLEISVGGVVFVFRWCASLDGAKAERDKLLTLHRRLGVLLGVADG